MNDLQRRQADKQREVARTLAQGMSSVERAALAAYVETLSRIRESEAHPTAKAKQAWAATLNSKVVWPVVRTILEEVKRHAWDDRGIRGRAGIATSATALAIFGSQGAGIAALGGAIGVPLWLVFGAGGAFLAGLYEELHKKEPGNVSSATSKNAVARERRAVADVVDVEARPVSEVLVPGDAPPASLHLKRRTIAAGDIISCLACAHERVVTHDWLAAISRSKGIDSIARHGLQAADLAKLKCAGCGGRSLEIKRF